MRSKLKSSLTNLKAGLVYTYTVINNVDTEDFAMGSLMVGQTKTHHANAMNFHMSQNILQGFLCACADLFLKA